DRCAEYGDWAARHERAAADGAGRGPIFRRRIWKRAGSTIRPQLSDVLGWIESHRSSREPFGAIQHRDRVAQPAYERIADPAANQPDSRRRAERADGLATGPRRVSGRGEGPHLRRA